MKKLAFFLFILLFLVSCIKEDTPSRTGTECTQASDCMKGGCSSQICAPKNEANDIITTCEYKPEYDCYQQTSCSCVNGTCGWENQQQLDNCIAQKRTSSL